MVEQKREKEGDHITITIMKKKDFSRCKSFTDLNARAYFSLSVMIRSNQRTVTVEDHN